ncbi:MAG: hypothetical protein ABH805_00590 [Candidatus Nealsonbacteria bacterium]
MIFSGFNITPPENETIKSLQLRLSLAGQGKKGDELIIDYFYQNVWHNVAVFNLENEISNNLNKGYFLYGLPAFGNWFDLDNLKVRLTYLSENQDSPDSVYLDAVWLELETEKVKEEVEVKETKKTEKFSLKPGKKSWRADESPEFEIAQSYQNLWDRIVSIFEKKEKLVVLIGPNGNEIESGAVLQGNKIKLANPKARRLKPGVYTLKINIKVGEEEFIQEQQFAWGVLAINTSKSIYLTGDQAHFQMAALDNGGHTICNANLRLDIVPPNRTSPISLKIERSSQCARDNVTDKPDYSAYYGVSDPGLYEMRLINLDTGYEISDFFQVKKSVPFDVERIGPTRVKPPANYEMTFWIKANQNFRGEITEIVPSEFDVQESSDTRQEIQGEDKLIIWNVDFKAGETYWVRYKFNSPKVSPYLYLMGPLTFKERDWGLLDRLIQFKISNLVFKEARNWQIASDAPGTRTIEQQINIIDQEYTTAVDTGEPTDNSLGLIRWTGGSYAGSDTSVYFEAILKENNDTNTASSTLYTAAGAPVAGSTITTGSSAYTRVRSGDIFSSLASGTDYTVRVSMETGSTGSALIKAARLIVVQSTTTGFITDTETQVEVGNASSTINVTTYTTTTDPKIYLYDSSKFTPTPSPIYFEATISSTPGSTVNDPYTPAATTTNWTVPAGVSSLTVMVWGGGGGSGSGGDGAVGGTGGGGGYVEDTISVSPGDQFTIVVGAGGGPGLTAGFKLDGSGGGGGGYSALIRQSDSAYLLIGAGGGGGGSGSESGDDGGDGGGGGTHTTSGVTGGRGTGGTSGGCGGTGGTSIGVGTAGSCLAGSPDGTNGVNKCGGKGGDATGNQAGGAGGSPSGGNGGTGGGEDLAGGGGGGGGRYGGGGGESADDSDDMGAGGGGGGSGLCQDGTCADQDPGSGVNPGNTADRTTYCAGTSGNGGAEALTETNGEAGVAGCVVISYLNPSGTTYAQLISTDGTVTVGEISTTSTSWVRARSGDISGSLTSGKEYVVQVKTSSASAPGAIANAKLILDQSAVPATGIASLELYHQYVNTGISTTTTSYDNTQYNNYYDPASFAGGDFTRYFETTMKAPAGQTIYADLASTTTAITNSATSTVATSYVRARSENSLTMPTLVANIDTRTYVSAGTGYLSNSWIIHQVTNLNRSIVDLTADKITSDTGNTSLSREETNQWMGTFGFQADFNSDTMTGIDITLDGTAAVADVDNIYLYWDDTDDTYDGTEPLFASSAISAVKTTFTSSTGVTVDTTKRYIHVVFDIAAGATFNNTTGAKIANNGDIVYSGSATSTGASITTGTGTIFEPSNVNQLHYRWRNDDDVPDPGHTWSAANTGLPGSTIINSFVTFNASSTHYLYMVGDYNEIYRTSDGITWSAAKTGLVASHYKSIVTFNASSTSYLYVAGENTQVFRTSDGTTWEPANTGIAINHYYSLATFSASSTSYLYAAGSSGSIYRTQDGTTWEAANTGLPSVNYFSLVSFSASSTSYLYAAGGSGNIYRTQDGLTWEPANTGLLSTTYFSLASFSASSISYLYAAGESGNIYRTQDGLTWEPAINGLPSINYRSLATFSASSTSYLYVAGDTGGVPYIYRTGDMATWKASIDTAVTGQAKNENVRLRFNLENTGAVADSYNYRLQWATSTEATCELQTTGWVDVPVSGADDYEPAVMADSAYFTNTTTTGNILNAGKAWGLATTSLPGGSALYYSLASFSASSTSYLYVAGESGNIYRTQDGLTWELANTGLPSDYYFNLVSFSASSTSYLYAAGGSGNIYRTQDGLTWEPANIGLPSAHFFSLASFSASSTSYLYAVGNSYNIYRTQDGLTWEPTNIGLPSGFFYSLATFSASSTSYLYAAGWSVAAPAYIYRTRDGITWEPANTGMPANIFYSLASFSASSTSYLYAAGQSGYIYRTQDGLTWNPANTGIPSVTFRSLASFSASSISYFYVAGETGNIYRTRDGITWEATGGSSTRGLATFSASSTSYLYAAGTSGKVWRTPKYTIVRGYGVENTVNQSLSITLAKETSTELEYNFQFNNNAIDGAAYCFRATNAGAALEQYDKVAKITVAGAVGPTAPSITFLTSLHNGVNITIPEWSQGGGTYQATTTFRVQDDNLLADISTTTLFVYRSGIVAGEGTCSTTDDLDINNCYPSTSSDSVWSPTYGDGAVCALDATGVDYADFMCTTTFYYVAEATDAGSVPDYSAQNWVAFASTSDLSGAGLTKADNTVNVLTNQAVALDTAGTDTINYSTVAGGNLSAGGNTGVNWATTTATTTGNIVIDLHFDGGYLSSAGLTSIPAYWQRFTTTTSATYGTDDIQLPTSTDWGFSGETHDLTMKKPTTTDPSSLAADQIYWGIGIPTGQAAGTYASSTTLTPTSTVVSP